MARNLELLREAPVTPVYVPLPWERQMRETHYAFSMFKSFLTMPERNLRRTVGGAERENGRRKGSFLRFAKIHRWIERAEEWDRYIEKVASDAKVGEIEKMVRKHARMSAKIADIGMRRIEQLEEEMDVISPADAISMVKTGITLERKSSGLDGASQGGNKTINIVLIEESPDEPEHIEANFRVLSEGE